MDQVVADDCHAQLDDHEDQGRDPERDIGEQRDGLAAEDDGHSCPADAGEHVHVGHREQVADETERSPALHLLRYAQPDSHGRQVSHARRGGHTGEDDGQDGSPEGKAEVGGAEAEDDDGKVHSRGEPEEELGAGLPVAFDVGDVLDAVGLDFGEAVAVAAVFGDAVFGGAHGVWAHFCPNVGCAPRCAA